MSSAAGAKIVSKLDETRPNHATRRIYGSRCPAMSSSTATFGTRLATIDRREVERLQPKSGRSKKGGAGTSACFRKLRGRSTTSSRKRPVQVDGPFCVAGSHRSQGEQVAVRDDHAVAVGIEMTPAREGQPGERHRHALLPFTPLAALPGHRGHGLDADRHGAELLTVPNAAVNQETGPLVPMGQ